MAAYTTWTKDGTGAALRSWHSDWASIRKLINAFRATHRCVAILTSASAWAISPHRPTAPWRLTPLAPGLHRGSRIEGHHLVVTDFGGASDCSTRSSIGNVKGIVLYNTWM
ncbi:MAG: hypothetical protein IPF41_12280 [Flavobacteriales bacterium]|nr:hypothetical protein [Flavobacteriales bacterium]